MRKGYLADARNRVIDAMSRIREKYKV